MKPALAFGIDGALYILLVFAEFSQHAFPTRDVGEKRGVAMAGNAGPRLYFFRTLPVFTIENVYSEPRPGFRALDLEEIVMNTSFPLDVIDYFPEEADDCFFGRGFHEIAEGATRINCGFLSFQAAPLSFLKRPPRWLRLEASSTKHEGLDVGVLFGFGPGLTVETVHRTRQGKSNNGTSRSSKNQTRVHSSLVP